MKGMSCQCFLREGKFLLISGVDKYRDSLWFYSIFDRLRPYTPGYGGNFATLLQQPVSSLLLNRTIFLGKLQKGIARYVPGVTVQDLDIGYLGESRKDFVVKINYSYQEEGTSVQDVTFV